MEHAQLQLSLKRKLLHLADRPVRSSDPRTIGIKIENDALAVTTPAQLGDLLTAEGGTKRCHSVGDARRMQGNDIEITLHHHSSIVLADRIGRLIQTEEVLAFFKDLCFGRIQILGIAAIKASTAKANDPSLPIANRNDHPATEAVIKPVASFSWHDKAR